MTILIHKERNGPPVKELLGLKTGEMTEESMIEGTTGEATEERSIEEMAKGEIMIGESLVIIEEMIDQGNEVEEGLGLEKGRERGTDLGGIGLGK